MNAGQPRYQSNFLDLGQNRIFSIARILVGVWITIGIKDSEYVTGSSTKRNVRSIYQVFSFPRRFENIIIFEKKINIFSFLFFFFPRQTWNKPITRTIINYLVVKVAAYLGQSPFFIFRWWEHCLNAARHVAYRGLIKIMQDLIRPVSLGEKEVSTQSR